MAADAICSSYIIKRKHTGKLFVLDKLLWHFLPQTNYDNLAMCLLGQVRKKFKTILFIA